MSPAPAAPAAQPARSAPASIPTPATGGRAGHYRPDRFAGRAISYGFPINRREQIPPNEVSIGVRLVWVYRPPTGFASLNITLEESTVMKAAPVLL